MKLQCQQQLFENLVISDKCKTNSTGSRLSCTFENLVISDKCKTTHGNDSGTSMFENFVILNKYKMFNSRVILQISAIHLKN